MIVQIFGTTFVQLSYSYCDLTFSLPFSFSVFINKKKEGYPKGYKKKWL